MLRPDGRLVVGVIERPPFATLSPDGAALGMAVDLWRLAAEALDVPYRLVPLEGDPAAALAAGEVDLALPVAASPELTEAAELTQPIYTATLGVASERSFRIIEVAQGFLTLRFLQLVFWLSLVLFGVGALVWAVERRRNSEQFSRHPLKGLGDGFWWAGVTLTTIGYGDKAPITALGRAVAMLWMLTGLAVSAALTAAVVTLAGVGQGGVDLPEALDGEAVGVPEGATAARYLDRSGTPYTAYPDVDAALTALDEGLLDAVVADAPGLRAAIDGSGAFNFSVETTSRDPHHVAFAMPEGSPLRRPLDAALLRILTSESGWSVIERYLPEES